MCRKYKHSFLNFAYLIIYTYQSEKLKYESSSLSTQVNQQVMPNLR